MDFDVFVAIEGEHGVDSLSLWCEEGVAVRVGQ